MNTMILVIEDYPSVYSRFFDDKSSYWEKDREFNLMFLKSREHFANDLLKTIGYVFLNEVYTSLGLLPTQIGAFVGWRLSPDSEPHISFGDFEKFAQQNDNSFLLEFNVDGVILDALEAV